METSGGDNCEAMELVQKEGQECELEKSVPDVSLTENTDVALAEKVANISEKDHMANIVEKVEMETTGENSDKVGEEQNDKDGCEAPRGRELPKTEGKKQKLEEGTQKSETINGGAKILKTSADKEEALGGEDCEAMELVQKVGQVGEVEKSVPDVSLTKNTDVALAEKAANISEEEHMANIVGKVEMEATGENSDKVGEEQNDKDGREIAGDRVLPQKKRQPEEDIQKSKVHNGDAKKLKISTDKEETLVQQPCKLECSHVIGADHSVTEELNKNSAGVSEELDTTERIVKVKTENSEGLEEEQKGVQKCEAVTEELNKNSSGLSEELDTTKCVVKVKTLNSEGLEEEQKAGQKCEAVEKQMISKADKKREKTEKNSGGSKKSKISSHRGKTPIDGKCKLKKVTKTKESVAKKAKDDTLRIAVVLRGFPDIKMTKEQAEMVVAALVNRIDVDRRNPIMFTEMEYVKGGLVLTCTNRSTKLWLFSALKYIVLWPGAKLVMGPANITVEGCRLLLWLTYPLRKKSDSQILNLLQKQNKGISTDKWKIIRRDSESIDRERRTIWIDDESFEYLKARNLVLFLGLGRTKLMPLSKWMDHIAKNRFIVREPSVSDPSESSGSESPEPDASDHWEIRGSSSWEKIRSHSRERLRPRSRERLHPRRQERHHSRSRERHRSRSRERFRSRSRERQRSSSRERHRLRSRERLRSRSRERLRSPVKVRRHSHHRSRSKEHHQSRSWTGDTIFSLEGNIPHTRERRPSPVRERRPSPVRERRPSPVRERRPSPVRERRPSPVRERRSLHSRKRHPSLSREGCVTDYLPEPPEPPQISEMRRSASHPTPPHSSSYLDLHRDQPVSPSYRGSIQLPPHIPKFSDMDESANLSNLKSSSLASVLPRAQGFSALELSQLQGDHYRVSDRAQHMKSRHSADQTQVKRYCASDFWQPPKTVFGSPDPPKLHETKLEVSGPSPPREMRYRASDYTLFRDSKYVTPNWGQSETPRISCKDQPAPRDSTYGVLGEPLKETAILQNLASKFRSSTQTREHAFGTSESEEASYDKSDVAQRGGPRYTSDRAQGKKYRTSDSRQSVEMRHRVPDPPRISEAKFLVPDQISPEEVRYLASDRTQSRDTRSTTRKQNWPENPTGALPEEPLPEIAMLEELESIFLAKKRLRERGFDTSESSQFHEDNYISSDRARRTEPRHTLVRAPEDEYFKSDCRPIETDYRAANPPHLRDTSYTVSDRALSRDTKSVTTNRDEFHNSMSVSPYQSEKPMLKGLHQLSYSDSKFRDLDEPLFQDSRFTGLDLMQPKGGRVLERDALYSHASRAKLSDPQQFREFEETISHVPHFQTTKYSGSKFPL